MSGEAVALDGVSFRYEGADALALRGLSMTVPTGQCVVLTGGSGCGKTTVTRLVNGLIPASYGGELAGEVRVAGVEAREWEMSQLCRKVGSVFQNPRSQFFNLDTTSEVAFGCENVGLSRADIRGRVEDSFERLGIGGLRDRDILALSGGQRQMVALASAYAMGPDIFVLDEPTASLDPVSMHRLARVIGHLRAQGKTIIIAEHRLWWLAGVVDRVVTMEGGLIVADCTAEEFSRGGIEERAARGLRAWSLDAVVPATPRRLPCRAEDSLERPALEISGLRAGYRAGDMVLKGVEMRGAPGSVVALVGRNGAGKTTLSRCMVGLHREEAGSILFHGTKPRRRDRSRFAYLVMQETGYQLFSDTVEGEIAGAFARGKNRVTDRDGGDAVSAALERYGLADVARRHPLSLSGGQRQRLAIAAGLLQGARVLVLDEPTSGLDRRNMARVAHEVRRAADRGALVVIVTHDYEFICAACDEVAVVASGVVTDVMEVDGRNLVSIRSVLGVDG